jgi:hypothetical protein
MGLCLGLKLHLIMQTVLLDAVDAEAIGADMAAADEGAAGGKPLSEKDGAKRRHVTLMDWGTAPVVEITVSTSFTSQAPWV